MSATGERSEPEILEALRANRQRLQDLAASTVAAQAEREQLWIVAHLRFGTSYDVLGEHASVSASFVNQTLRELGYGRHTKGSK